MNGKYFADAQGAASKLRSDVGTNNVKIYDIPNYSEKVNIEVQPSGLLKKLSHVAVAVSGDLSTGHEWMAVVPFRVDHADEGTGKVLDIDPILFFFDSDSRKSHPSGVVAYHQKFPGRTTTVTEEHQSGSIDVTVQNLRATLTTGLQPLDRSPQEVTEALAHMVKTFGAEFK